MEKDGLHGLYGWLVLVDLVEKSISVDKSFQSVALFLFLDDIPYPKCKSTLLQFGLSCSYDS